MLKHRNLSMVFLVAMCSSPAAGQVGAPSVLVIRLENQVEYQQDTPDASSFATNPNITHPERSSKNFGVATILADIVSVNGEPAKGVYVGRTRRVSMSPSPIPGEAIADVRRTAIREVIVEILKSDGTPIGSIVGLGFSGGSAPPGAPLARTGGSWAIVGGTGAFLGVRGEFGGAQPRGSIVGREASMTEDPANRRSNKGGTQPLLLSVIPMVVPEITTILGEPAVMHSSDSSLVTSSAPAASGELLFMYVTNLGPTVASIDPGERFPTTPPAVVNAPVAVKVNGRQAELIAAVGIPGTANGYQVTFRVPPDTAQGLATIQVIAAWIAGPDAKIAIH